MQLRELALTSQPYSSYGGFRNLGFLIALLALRMICGYFSDRPSFVKTFLLFEWPMYARVDEAAAKAAANRGGGGGAGAYGGAGGGQTAV